MCGQDDIYDQLYTEGYRETLSPYDFARSQALKHLVTKVVKVKDVRSVLDYGCGSGIYVGLWENIFPAADLSFCDISSVALKTLAERYPEYKRKCVEIKRGWPAFDDDCFDVVVSVEVMEHVSELQSYLADIFRLLRPGGTFVWTTPCANRFSIEYIYSFLTGNIEKSSDGFVRWKWEDPTHIRRLRTGQLRDMMVGIGYNSIDFRFRSHLFSFVYTQLFKGPLRSLGRGILLWDYILFRRFPNGAAMIGIARKPLR